MFTPQPLLPPLFPTLRNPVALRAAAFAWKNCPLQNKGRTIFVTNVVPRRSLISRSPDWQSRVNCPHPRRRQTAVAQGASRANHAPAQAHQMPQVVFCASPSAASAAAIRLRCRGMYSVWASAPHVPIYGVCMPSTGHCDCRYAHGA